MGFSFCTLRRRGLRAAGLGVILGVITAGPGVYADTPADAAADAESSDSLSEVVVTTSKLGSDIRRAAVATVELSPSDLQDTHVLTLSDLAAKAPSVVTSNPAGSFQPYIRGIGTHDALAGLESPVATYVDGVYLQRTFGASLDVVDLKSVDILKGPQGTLYGRNATGGAILLTTNDPTNTFGGSVNAEYGRFGSSRVEAVLNLPLNDVLAIRLAGSTRRNDGYLRNINDNKMVGDGHSDYGRIKVRFAPGEHFVAVYTAEFDDTVTTSFQQSTSVGPPYCLFCAVIPTAPLPFGKGFYVSSQSDDADNHNNIRYSAHTLNLSYFTDKFNVTSITGYRSSHMNMQNDLDAIGPIAFEGHINETGPTITNDTYLRTTLPYMVNGLIGASYVHDHDQQEFWFGGTSDLEGGDPATVGDNRNDVRIDSYSAYTQLAFDFTSNVQLTAGARYNHDKKQIDATNNATGLAMLGIGPDGAAFSKQANFSNVTPRAVLSYDTHAGDYYYFSYNKGAKSGAFGSPLIDPSTKQANPETLTGLELGAKNTFLDGRLRTEADVFWGKYSDIQVQSVDQRTASILLENAASGKIRGVEFSGNLQVTSNFNTQVGVSYLKATFDSFPNAAVYAPGSGGNVTCGAVPPLGLASCIADLSGTRLPRSPEWSGYVSASYSQALPAGWTGRLSGNLHATTDYDLKTDAGGPLRLDRQPGFAKVDATLMFLAPNKTTEFGAYVTNLFEHHYFEDAATSGTGGYTIAALPRVFGIRLRQSF